MENQDQISFRHFFFYVTIPPALAKACAKKTRLHLKQRSPDDATKNPKNGAEKMGIFII
jgi:hypothetical protein